MPKSDKLSLTTFVDYFKNRDEYDPATDFYRPLRDEIVRMHTNGEPKRALDAFLGTVHAKKHAQYAAVIAGYQKYLGRRP